MGTRGVIDARTPCTSRCFCTPDPLPVVIFLVWGGARPCAIVRAQALSARSKSAVEGEESEAVYDRLYSNALRSERLRKEVLSRIKVQEELQGCTFVPQVRCCLRGGFGFGEHMQCLSQGIGVPALTRNCLLCVWLQVNRASTGGTGGESVYQRLFKHAQHLVRCSHGPALLHTPWHPVNNLCPPPPSPTPARALSHPHPAAPRACVACSKSNAA